METTSTLSNNLHSYYQKRALEAASKVLRYRQIGKEVVHPKGNGKDYFALKWGHMTEKTTALTEGVVPTENTIDTTKYTVTIAQYGDYVKYTDFLDMTAISDVSDNIADECGYAAAKTMDSIIRDNLIANATSNIQYVGSGNSADNDIAATEVFTAQDFLKPTRILKADDAPPRDDGLYTAIVHPYISHDLQADTSAGGLIELTKYVNGMDNPVLRGEIGRAYNCRILESTNVTSAANTGSVNVYRAFVFAKDPFLMTKFNQDAIEIIYKGMKEGGVANPLNQVGSVGWKMHFGVKYIGDSFSGDNDAGAQLAVQLRGAATGG